MPHSGHGGDTPLQKFLFAVDVLRYKMQPSTASIPPCILLLFADLRSYGFSKLFSNKSSIFEFVRPLPRREAFIYKKLNKT